LLGVEGLLLGLAAALFLIATTAPAAAAAADEQQQQHRRSSQLQQDAVAAEEADAEQQQLLPGEDQHLQADQQQQQQQDHQTLLGNGCCTTTTSSSSSSSAPAMPSALFIVLLGLILTPIAHPDVLSQLSFGPSALQLVIPTLQQFKAGVLKAGLAQLPLTSLNSCIAVTQLAQQLFPQRLQKDGWRWRPGPVAVSVGLMNLVGCWWGAFPCCHGSGGLAAQVSVKKCRRHSLQSIAAVEWGPTNMLALVKGSILQLQQAKTWQ
jgi:hypothetical protein